MKEIEPKSQFSIGLARQEDIPNIIDLVKSVPEALIQVDEKIVGEWINKGYSLVAKSYDGRVIGHQGAGFWPKSGWIELRSAIVNPEYRGMGINTKMKKMLMGKIISEYPRATIVGFLEKASMSGGIFEKLGFKQISLDETPDEFFSICPDTCVRKTGVDCGCKVFKLTSEEAKQ